MKMLYRAKHASLFGCQTIQTMILNELKFFQKFLFERRKIWNLVPAHRRNLYLFKKEIPHSFDNLSEHLEVKPGCEATYQVYAVAKTA